MKIETVLDYLEKIEVEYEFYGNSLDNLDGFSSLNNYREKSITWIKKPDEFSNPDCVILCAVLNKHIVGNISNQIVVRNSKEVFFSILSGIFSDSTNAPENFVGKGTYIGPNVKIEPHVYIGYNCVLDGNISISSGTKIYNNVTIINNVTIGNNCVIESGVVIGHDGFSYDDKDPERKMIRHFGGVILKNKVHVGMNTVIARGTIDNTVLGNRVKIDTLCHIAHNCIIGNDVTIIAGTTLYGSTHIEDNAYIATSIIRNQCTIGENAFVGMGSVCTKDVPPNTVVIGVPAKARI